MRELKDYTLREWFRIKPIDHFMIEVANDTLQSVFCKLRPKALGHFLQDAQHLSGNDIGLVIAFEKPWVLDLLLKTSARNLTGGTLLVFDNSRTQEARKDIARVCQRERCSLSFSTALPDAACQSLKWHGDDLGIQ